MKASHACMIVAASLVLASCGTSDPDTPSDGGGDGDDGASESWGALSIDHSGFVVDGPRWWASTSDPVIRGLFVANGPVVIDVNVTGAASVPAELGAAELDGGSTWRAQLPAGSIGASGTTVTVVMTNRDGEQISVMQTFVLDTLAPGITLLPSLVDDERFDTIDFSSGEPVHTHAGPEILLTPSDCPVIYKHAYLTGANKPVFGSQTTRNPIRYAFWIDEAELDASFTAYRVRGPEDHVLRDWTDIAVYGWAYTIWLVKDGSQGIPELGKQAGKYFVDVRARDWAGLESTVTWCFDLRLLAAPLQIEALEPASLTSAGMPPLPSMTMSAGSPMSLLASHAIGPAVATQRIVQYTAEPIVLTYELTSPAMRFARTYIDDYIAVSRKPLSNTTCEQMTCDLPPLADPPDSTTSGPVTDHRWRMVLIDEATNEIVPALPDGTPVIPSRGPGEPPRGYRLSAHLGEVVDLRPSPGLVPDEYTVGNVTYTGRPLFDEHTRCTATQEHCHLDVCVTLCTEATTYMRMIALEHAALELEGLSVELRTSTGQVLDGDLLWGPPRSFALGALTWDSGQATLPGTD